MNKNYTTIKELLPPILIRKLTGLFYGWKGDYNSWEEAQNNSTGYDADLIIKNVKNALLKVKNGEAVYERDSVIFEKIEYSFPLLSGLMWIANQNNGKLNLIDFGGSLGSSYYQNKFFLDSLNLTHWNIVEQKHFVECGKEFFQNDQLHFYKNIDECLISNKPDTILFSSVLQYIEQPYELIRQVLGYNFTYIIFDRTPFINSKDRITIQKTHPKIYKTSYPCWFFNENKFITAFQEKYQLVCEFDALDKANIKSNFKGFIFKIKKNNV